MHRSTSTNEYAGMQKRVGQKLEIWLGEQLVTHASDDTKDESVWIFVIKLSRQMLIRIIMSHDIFGIIERPKGNESLKANTYNYMQFFIPNSWHPCSNTYLCMYKGMFIWAGLARLTGLI